MNNDVFRNSRQAPAPATAPVVVSKNHTGNQLSPASQALLEQQQRDAQLQEIVGLHHQPHKAALQGQQSPVGNTSHSERVSQLFNDESMKMHPISNTNRMPTSSTIDSLTAGSPYISGSTENSSDGSIHNSSFNMPYQQQQQQHQPQLVFSHSNIMAMQMQQNQQQQQMNAMNERKRPTIEHPDEVGYGIVATNSYTGPTGYASA